MRKATNRMHILKTNGICFIEITKNNDSKYLENAYKIEEVFEDHRRLIASYASINHTKKGYTIEYMDCFSNKIKTYLKPSEWIFEL
jgi:hypothetical protein